MAINIPAGNNQQKAAIQAWGNFKAAETPMKSKFSGLTNPQKTAALNAITSWDFAAASPTVARENALFLAIALLYVVVGYIARQYIKNQG